jgi:hypothetical protein
MAAKLLCFGGKVTRRGESSGPVDAPTQQHIGEPEPTAGADLARQDLAAFDQAHQIGAEHAEQAGGLAGCGLLGVGYVAHRISTDMTGRWRACAMECWPGRLGRGRRPLCERESSISAWCGGSMCAAASANPSIRC